MKGVIICPKCIERNEHIPKENRHKPQALGKYENIVGKGDLYLWCKRCRKEIRIRIGDISLDE